MMGEDNGKDNIRIPEPKEQYDFSNQKQINRCLSYYERTIKFNILR